MKKKKGVLLKVGLWYLFILTVLASYTNWLPQIRGDAPEAAQAIDVSAMTPEKFAALGLQLVFGTDDPKAALARGEGPIGKGQCPLCHQFFMDQKADRCPNLIGLPSRKAEGRDDLVVHEEKRSHFRAKEERYKQFVARLAGGEPNSGVKPHASPEDGSNPAQAGTYLIESEYCPNCYVVEGFGQKGTNDTESPMPIINKPPIGLTDSEIVSVVSFLQSKDTPGDFSKVTAKESWELFFGKKLQADAPPAAGATQVAAGPPIALVADTPEQIVQKMTCFICHKIPGISIAKTGMVGPLLIEGTNAPNRIKSPEYLKAVAEGKAHAKTPKEYVMESIMTPGVFIVPGFADDMLKDFSHKFTFAALEKMADYLLQQTAETALKEGLDRLPNEKEGSLKGLKKVDLAPPPENRMTTTKEKLKEGQVSISGLASGGTF